MLYVFFFSSFPSIFFFELIPGLWLLQILVIGPRPGTLVIVSLCRYWARYIGCYFPSFFFSKS